MEASIFTRLFPKLYHLTFASNLASIREHGLLSSSELADRYAFSLEEREACLNRRRLCIQELHGIAIRDQRPAHESRMKTCLVNVTIPEWLALLNSKVFFFASLNKAAKFIAAYEDYANLLLEVDTATLLFTHADSITLSRMNTGSFLFNPRPRGRDSFISLADYQYRNSRDIPAEITINEPIPNVLEFSTFTLLPQG